MFSFGKILTERQTSYKSFSFDAKNKYNFVYKHRVVYGLLCAFLYKKII